MVIALSHQKGGVGKSTIAYNLAVELAKKYEVEVVDLDVQKTITACNMARDKFGQEKLYMESFSDHKEFIKFLEADHSDRLIIVDTGGFDSGYNRVAMYYADMIITPVSTEFLEILGLQTYRKIIKEISKKASVKIKVNVVLNKVHHSQQNFSEIENFINKYPKQFDMFNTKLRRRMDYSVSLSHGFSVCEFDRNSDSSKEIESLISEIEDKLKLNENKKLSRRD